MGNKNCTLGQTLYAVFNPCFKGCSTLIWRFLTDYQNFLRS